MRCYVVSGEPTGVCVSGLCFSEWGPRCASEMLRHYGHRIQKYTYAKRDTTPGYLVSYSTRCPSVCLNRSTKEAPSAAPLGPLITAESRRDDDENETSAMNNTPACVSA